MEEPDLKLVEECLKKFVLQRWSSGDIIGAMMYMRNSVRMHFVFDNMKLLLDIGKYEEALLDAYFGTKFNLSSWSMGVLKFLFQAADRKRLEQAGEPIPDREFFSLYRGVGGNGPSRRVNGFSWTSSLDKAVWFAERAQGFGFQDPAVFSITVQRENILAYSNQRNENEYLLALPLPAKPRRVKRINADS